ncbi:MAG: hypothetical protein RL660_1364 [Bacteroidota bacterium]|jgi:hypothetical protein
MMHLITNRRTTLVTIVVTLLSIAWRQASAQTNQCGFDHLLQAYIDSNEAEYDALESFMQANKQQSNAGAKLVTSPGGQIYVPVVFHLIGDEASALSDGQVLAALAKLNNDFNDQAGSTVSVRDNAHFTFCLAQNHPAPSNLGVLSLANNGIIRYSGTQTVLVNGSQIHLDTIANYGTVDEPSGPYLTTPPTYFGYNSLRPLANLGRDSVLDVFVVTRIGKTHTQPGSLLYGQYLAEVGGYATFPPYEQFAIVTTAISDTQSDILAHEAGHYFALYHTFQDGCASATLATCDNSGDRCCDTPPVASNNDVGNLGYDCANNMPLPNSCSETYNGGLPDQIENYMDYSANNCKNTFTVEQCNRMTNAAQFYRPKLVSISNLIASGLLAPSGCANGLVSSYFTVQTSASGTAATSYGCVTDSLTLIPTYIDSAFTYTWQIAPAYAGNISNTIMASGVQLPAAGIYTITLTVTKIVGTDTTTRTSELEFIAVDCSTLSDVNERWFFGQNNTVGFKTGIASVENNNAMSTDFAAAQWCYDTANAKYLYTEGRHLWRRQGGIDTMVAASVFNANPNDLLYRRGSNAVAMCPVPGKADTFVVITCSGWGPIQNGVSFYFVSTAGTVPLVISGPHHPAINYRTAAPIAIVPHEDNFHYWALVLPVDTLPGQSSNVQTLTPLGNMAAYLITPAGLADTPVLTTIGTTDVVNGGPLAFPTIVVAPNKRYLAVHGNALRFANFDSKTGKCAPAFAGQFSAHRNGCFSPNSNYYYTGMTNSSHIWQLDMQTQSVCANTVPATAADMLINTGFSYFQIGPDNRIYLTHGNSIAGNKQFLSAICRPDSQALTGQNNIQFAFRAVSLNSKHQSSLPNIITGHYGATANDFRFNNCACGLVTFTPIKAGINFTWDFGDGTTPITGAFGTIPPCVHHGRTYGNYEYPYHIYQATGTYTVTLTVDGNAPVSHVVNITQAPPAPPTITLSADSICAGGDTVQLGTSQSYSSYAWSISGGTPSTASTATLNAVLQIPNCVSVRITSGGCVNASDTQVHPLPLLTGISVYPSTYCPGDSVLLVANASTCTNVPITYTWKDSNVVIGTTDSMYVIADTTLSSYMVVASNGVQADSAAITLSPAAVPNTPSIASSAPCGYVVGTILTASAGYSSYSWAPQVATTNTIAIGTNTTYTVTVTNSSGCTASATHTPPATSLVPTYTTLIGCVDIANPIASVVMTPGYGTYTCVPQQAGISGDTIKFNSPNTVYTITASNGAGCISNTTVFIANCEDCPHAPSSARWLPPNTNASAEFAYTNQWQATQALVMLGNFNVNKNFTITNAIPGAFTPTYLVANAAIDLSAIGGIRTFTLDKAHLQACHSNMYYGVRADASNETLIVKNSKLQDALHGCELANKATFSAMGNTFFNNGYESIYLRNHANTSASAGSYTITNNTFTQTIPTLAMGNYPNTISLTGIRINGLTNTSVVGSLVPMLTLGGSAALANNFTNITNGIVTEASHPVNISYNNFDAVITGVHATPGIAAQAYALEVNNNNFSNIMVVTSNMPNPVSTEYQKPEGACVFVARPPNNVINFSTYTYLKCSTNTYNNSYRGNVLNVCSGEEINNTCNTVWYALMHSYPGELRIQGNTINDCSIGIQLLDLLYKPVRVEQNTITLSPNPYWVNVLMGTWGPNSGSISYTPWPTMFWPMGIDAQQSTSLINGQATIGSSITTLPDPNSAQNFANHITIPGLGGTGIRLTNCGSGTRVLNNLVRYTNANNLACSTILIHSNPPIDDCGRTYALYASNCYQTTIQGNKLISTNTYGGAGTATAFARRFTVGMHLQDSKELTIQCNTIARMQYGMYVVGDCKTLQQSVAGNSMQDHRTGWLFRSFTGNAGGFGLAIGSSLPGAEDNANIWSGNYHDMYNTGHPTKVLTLTNDVNQRKIYIKDDNSNSIRLQIPQCKSNVGGASGMYRAQLLSNYGHLTNNCTAPLPPAPPAEGDRALTLDEAEDITEDQGLDYMLFDPTSDYRDKRYLYGLLVTDENWRESEQALEDFYIAQQNTNLRTLHLLENYMALLRDSVVLADSLVHDSIANAANMLEQTFASNAHYEQCDKWISSIDRRLHNGSAALSAAEQIQLGVLASSCPAAMGACVYRARAILSQFNPSQQYNDLASCSEYLAQNKNVQNLIRADDIDLQSDDTERSLALNTTCNLAPNPIKAGDMVTITCEQLLPGTQAQLQLINVHGAVLLHVPTDVATGTLQVPSSIAPGLYFVKLKTDGGSVYTWKLQILD